MTEENIKNKTYKEYDDNYDAFSAEKEINDRVRLVRNFQTKSKEQTNKDFSIAWAVMLGVTFLYVCYLVLSGKM
ncbi:MAG: hypothetical protein VZR09_11000 [Candidatus Gastranaerophilaceae bacterium]|nr:hypothetical protein [Candidatus Gastranaerophilaceae bacterium]